MGVVGIVGEKSLGKNLWTGRMGSLRLLASVCGLREEERSVGQRDCGGLRSSQEGHMRNKVGLFRRRNSQLSLLTPHSIHL